MNYDRTLKLNVNTQQHVEPLGRFSANGAWVPAACPEQILGTKFPVVVTFYDVTNGGATIQEFDGDYTLELLAASRNYDPLFVVSDFEYSAGAWTGTVSLNTQELLDAMSDYRRISVLCDLRLLSADGSLVRVWQFEMPIRRYAYSFDPVQLNPASEYYTKDQCDAMFGRIAGAVEIPVGQYHVEVTGLDLSDPPKAVLLTLRTPTADAPPVTVWVAGGLTQDGFLVMASSPVPSDGYVVYYDVVRST